MLSCDALGEVCGKEVLSVTNEGQYNRVLAHKTMPRIPSWIALLQLLLFIYLGQFARAEQEICRNRTLDVSVTDQDWAPIVGLHPNDLVGEYQGKPVQILSLTADSSPRRIVILLDASGSMIEIPKKWKLACSLVSDVIEHGSAKTSFALLTFKSRIQDQMDFSYPPDAIQQKLQSISVDPAYVRPTKGVAKTALWDTVIAALALLGKPTLSDAIYVITDGGDNASLAHLKEVKRHLAISGVRAFASIVFSATVYWTRTTEEINGPKDLVELTETTGGAFFGPLGVDQSGGLSLGGSPTRDSNLKMTAIMANFYQTMRTGYRVQIALPNEVQKWSEWNLSLSKEKKKEFPYAQFSYMRDLVPCSELANQIPLH